VVYAFELLELKRIAFFVDILPCVKLNLVTFVVFSESPPGRDIG